MDLTYSELKQKEVVNICDGRRLGRISDLVFSFPKGIVSGIVVPGCSRVSLFRSAPELFISLGCIVRIGEDVILVDMKTSGSSCSPRPSGKTFTACFSAADEPASSGRESMDDYE